MTTLKQIFPFALSLALVVGIVLGALWFKDSVVFASAPSGLPATVATSSNPIVTSTGNLIFATSTCTARIISTATSSIMIKFNGVGGAPTSSFGHWQGASTTVAYDSGQYGCEALSIYSFSSQLITVTETR